MKYYKRLNEYKMSNVVFNCDDKTAWSYGWWCFFKDGVFNNVNYSSTTNRHQSKVRTLLNDLGINTVLTLRFTRLGFQDGFKDGQEHGLVNALIDEIEESKKLITELAFLIAKPRTQAKKNEERIEEIEELKQHIQAVQQYLADYHNVSKAV